MKKQIIALALASLTVTSAVPAHAGVVSWPSGGEFTVGDVTWTVDGDGIVSGTDAGGTFTTPIALMHSPYINNGEVFDCTHGDPATDAIVTAEDNGDYTITCPSYTFDQGYGLTGQLIIRIFAPVDGQYWARSWYHFDADRNGGAWDLAVKDADRTAFSSTTNGSAGEVAISRVWFDPNSGTNLLFSEIDNNGDIFQIVSEDVNNGVADFVFFDTVVVPADSSTGAASAAAEAAAAAASGFVLTERFQMGLDPTTDYSGWTLASDASRSTNGGLADTGAEITTGVLAISVLAMALGGVLIFRRRAARVNR